MVKQSDTEPSIKRRRRLSSAKRDAIIEAAKCEVREFGYSSTSMDGIALRAGVSKRTVYNHFENKKSLFMFLVSDLYHRARRETDVRFRQDMPLQVQLREIAEKEAACVSAPAFLELARLTIPEYIRSPELLHDIFTELGEGESSILNWLREAAAQNRIRVNDPVIAARQFTALMKSFFFWPQLFGSNPPDAENRRIIIETNIRMFLNFYTQTDNQPFIP
jgi:TetR/AcrR family transcriptional regulator, regulator of autoinduction and epiphytic fitness